MLLLDCLKNVHEAFLSLSILTELPCKRGNRQGPADKLISNIHLQCKPSESPAPLPFPLASQPAEISLIAISWVTDSVLFGLQAKLFRDLTVSKLIPFPPVTSYAFPSLDCCERKGAGEKPWPIPLGLQRFGYCPSSFRYCLICLGRHSEGFLAKTDCPVLTLL